MKNLVLLTAVTAALAALLADSLTAQTLTSLHTFSTVNQYNCMGPHTNSDGASPGDLVLSDNTLYGCTAVGGTSGGGTVFAIRSDGRGFQRSIHLLAAATGLLRMVWFYQAALCKVNTDGTGFRVLHIFSALDANDHNADGAFPSAGLIVSGSILYGSCWYGGGSDAGTVFKVNTDGTGFRTLHSFSGGDIVTVPGGLVLSGNVLYGTTWGGPPSGSVFSVKTDGTGFVTLHSFTPTFFANTNECGESVYTNWDGAGPAANFLGFSSNTLYGSCNAGGGVGNGAVFSLALPRPQITITPSVANVILTWPANATGFTLQSTTNLGSSAIWTTVPPAPVIINGQNTVTNPISGTQQFYRLSQ